LPSLVSFPTRRSSDLRTRCREGAGCRPRRAAANSNAGLTPRALFIGTDGRLRTPWRILIFLIVATVCIQIIAIVLGPARHAIDKSEEHTSELQSHLNL